MGQRCCCRPQIQKDPKHTLLLNLIYNEVQENVKILDYDEIEVYFTRKGYIKTLSDYLSSHLNLISQSLLFCKNKQMSVRSKNLTLQLLFGCTTTQILQKIVTLYLEVNLKSVIKYRSNQATLQEKQQLSTKIMESQTKKVQQKQAIHQSGKAKHPLSISKVEVNQFDLIKDQINSIILETCSQLMKQTINIKNDKNALVTDKLKLQKVQQIQFRILMSVQVILVKILGQEEILLKHNNVVIGDILSSFIDILVMCRKPAEKISDKSNTVKFEQPLGLTTPNTQRSFMKNQMGNLNLEIQNQGKAPGFLRTSYFTQSENDVQQMKKLSLQNYYRLIKKANLHLANASFYKTIVKVHMPLLLEFWAGLVIESDNDLNRLSQISEQFGQQIQSSQEENMIKQKNIKVMNQIIQSIILEFFNCYFSFRESQYIYRQLMRIFDKLYFNRLKIAPLEKLVFHSLRKYDLKQSVVSKWFDYQLNYLGSIITVSNRNLNLSDSFYTDKKGQTQENVLEEPNYLWVLNENLNLLYEGNQYLNCFREENIAGCLKTIFTWIQSKQVNTDDILTYQHTKLLVVVMSNLAWGSPIINREIYKLVQHLILRDIRTFGHLVNTAIYFINKLKIPNHSELLGTQSWDQFLKGREIRKMNFHTEDQQLKNTEQLNLKMKNPSPIFRQIRKNQLISVEIFIEEIISIASYPFLSQHQNSLVQSIFYFQQSLIRRRNSINGEQNYPAMAQFKKTQSFLTIKEEQESGSNSKQKNSYICSDKSQKKINLFLSVFEETLGILFKDIDFHHSKVRYCYLIKLSGVTLVSNIKPIVFLVEKFKRNQDYSFSFHIVNTINKFLAKIYKQIKYVSASFQGLNARSGFETQNQLDNINYLENSKEEEENRNISLKKFCCRESRIKQLIFHSICLWVYPALTYMLSPELSLTENLNKKQQQNPIQSAIDCNYMLKFLIGTSIKLYFRNLVNIARQSLESLQQNLHLSQAALSDVEDNQTNKKEGFKNQKGDQYEIEKESVPRFYIPVIEVYKVFSQLYNKYQLIEPLILKQQQVNSVRRIQNHQNLRKDKKARSQIISGYSQNLQKQKLKSQRLRIQQAGQMIKIHLENLAAYNVNQKTKKTQFQTIKLKKKTLSNKISSVEKVNFSKEVSQKKVYGDQILKESNSVIFNPNLCHMLFFLVDQISKNIDNNEGNTYKFLSSDEVSWEKFIYNYLIRNQEKENYLEIVGRENECSLFSRGKNKIKSISNNQNVGNLNDSGVKQILKETGYTEGSEHYELNRENFVHLMPQLIAHLESKYYDYVTHLSQRKIQKNSSLQSDYFNLGENGFKVENSAINSSELKSGSLQDNSFNQVMSNIRKH